MPPPATPNRSILVVDDEVDILRFLRETLGTFTVLRGGHVAVV